MGLTSDQKQKVKAVLADRLISAVAKPLIKKLGDRMETSKRPFIRRVVRFFRREN